MLFPYENRIHLNVFILIRYFHGVFSRTVASSFLIKPTQISHSLRQQYRFATVNSIIRCSCYHYWCSSILRVEIYISGWTISRKKYIFMTKNAACCIKLSLYFSKNAEFNAYCLRIILGNLRQTILFK
jgi:hypothetical protein